MFQLALVFSLLASAVSAQLSSANLEKHVASLALCATITPPSTTIAATALPSVVYSEEFSVSIPTEISSQVPAISTGVDQPAPSAIVTLPASESFNPTNAPAFTESTDIPNPTIGPESSSTPCSSELVPTETPEASEAPEVPAASSTSCTENEAPATTAIPTETPAPQVPSDAEETPCPEDSEPTATRAEASVPPFTPLPTEAPYPTGTGRPSHEWGRPFPTGKWHHSGRTRPTGSFGHRPSAGLQPAKYDVGKAASTPCTLETRVRPTATGVAY